MLTGDVESNENRYNLSGAVNRLMSRNITSLSLWRTAEHIYS